jgi:hypothetical protein
MKITTTWKALSKPGSESCQKPKETVQRKCIEVIREQPKRLQRKEEKKKRKTAG